ncbi:equilibrative nucleoside transporter 4-like [Saccoglossus kowalevskii]
MYERIDMDDVAEDSMDCGEMGRIILDSPSDTQEKENGVVVGDDDMERTTDNAKDKYNMIYVAMVLAGIGFLLPYNSFITAVDYFHTKYPNTTIVFDMSLTYILVAFIAVLLNNILVETFTLHTRISFGYIVSFLSLTFVAIFEVWLDVFTQDVSYIIILAAVAAVALGCTAQQSSFYGYAGMLPKRFTQGVMTGESAAGLLTSINRIITKLLLKDKTINTLIFFGISIFFVIVCFWVHWVAKRSNFITYHMKRIRDAALPDDAKCVTDDNDDVRIHALVSSSSSSQVPRDRTTKLYDESTEPLTPSPSCDSDVMTVDIQLSANALKKYVGMGTVIKRGIALRLDASRTIWPYMLSIGMAYFVTLCLFPGVESEVISCNLGDWMPIILMALFNGCDFIGKIVAAIPYNWNPNRLVLASSLRIVIVPLMMICVAPRNSPLLSHESWSMIFSILLGLTNGYFGSVPMILASATVPEEQKELSGNIMTLSYNIGLTAGSGVAYALNYLLGPASTAITQCHQFINVATESP